MLICHNCGAIIEDRTKQCRHCHNFISAQSSMALVEASINNPLKIQLEPQPVVLNRLITPTLINATSKLNGHSETKPVSIETDKFFLSLPENLQPVDQITEQIVETKTPNLDSSPTYSHIGQPDFFAELPNTFTRNASVEDIEKANIAAPISLEPEFVPKDDSSASEDNSKTDISHTEKSNNKETSIATNWLLETPAQNQNSTADQISLNEEDTNRTADLTTNIPRRSFLGENADNKNKKTKDASKQKGSVLPQTIFTKLKKSLPAKFAFKSSWQTYLFISIILVFLLWKGFETFSSVGANLFSNFSHLNLSAAQGNSISGRWQFAAKWNNTGCRGEIVFHQRGNQIFGQGTDSQFGQYKFNGTRNGNHIDLLKQYFVGNNFVGHPIELRGDIDTNSKPLFINGNFSLEYMQGGKWRGKPVTVSGIWEAEMVQPLIEEEAAPANVPSIRKVDERPASMFGGFFSNVSKNGIWIAGLIVAGGVLLWHLASSLIGPDGWLGIWDKQKYVPPQFKGDHDKEKRQLSKPLMPGSLPLGRRREWKRWLAPFFWIQKDLAIPPDVRANNPHVLILGGGEKGKSRLMANMIAHDIESADRAVIVVDSDGGLADLLLRWLASHSDSEELAKRVIVIDPTSNIPAPSFNPLQVPDDADLQNAASSIVHGFKAIYHEPPGSQNQWSPQTAHILRNCAMLLMANGKTLVDLPTLLQDNDFRDILLEQIEKQRKEKVEYATLLETWGQYKRLARTEQWINWYEPILNRVGPTLINQRIRPILTQSRGDINLKQIIADKRILIVKIPKGQLHEDANLLGSLIVTGLKQSAISLCSAGDTNDRTAAMYLDEFDHFIEKETLDAITTETKKFQLSFTGSTKTLQHLPEDFRNQIVINIGTMCVFTLSKKDGDMLGPQMFRVSGRKAKHRTLMNIINTVNTSPQFELISDEEKFNIDRVLGQSERHFYAYRVGTVAGVFHMESHDFNDIPDDAINTELIELMYKNR